MISILSPLHESFLPVCIKSITNMKTYPYLFTPGPRFCVSQRRGNFHTFQFTRATESFAQTRAEELFISWEGGSGRARCAAVGGDSISIPVICVAGARRRRIHRANFCACSTFKSVYLLTRWTLRQLDECMHLFRGDLLRMHDCRNWRCRYSVTAKPR